MPPACSRACPHQMRCPSIARSVGRVASMHRPQKMYRRRGCSTSAAGHCHEIVGGTSAQRSCCQWPGPRLRYRRSKPLCSSSSSSSCPVTAGKSADQRADVFPKITQRQHQSFPSSVQNSYRRVGSEYQTPCVVGDSASPTRLSRIARYLRRFLAARYHGAAGPRLAGRTCAASWPPRCPRR
jgi:hypothetical protein